MEYDHLSFAIEFSSPYFECFQPPTETHDERERKVVIKSDVIGFTGDDAGTSDRKPPNF